MLTQALQQADDLPIFMLLTGNGLSYPEGSFPTILASGFKKVVKIEPGETKNKDFIKTIEDKVPPLGWFGFIGYDFKNYLEDVSTSNFLDKSFYDAFMFEPQKLEALDFEYRYNTIKAVTHLDKIALTSDFSFAQYKEKFLQIQEHLRKGNIYELNFCIEFSGQCNNFDPIHTWLFLNNHRPMPFGFLLKTPKGYVLCFSPERFLKKDNSKIISQPIKGTAARGHNKAEDVINKTDLFYSEKERAENMMIVDLTRNDLSKIAIEGSVSVDELFGVYDFPNVFQLISTVSAKVSNNQHWFNCLKAAFPMGSMTGAPKISAINIIDKIEKMRRGVYSGAGGFVKPDNSFDFNVIIRSLFFDTRTHNLSLKVGGAITVDSTAEKEFEECILKAKSVADPLGIQLKY